MNDDLESQLRAALRRVEPPEGFSSRVIARLEAARTRPRAALRFRSPGARWWLSAALAASLLIAVGLHARIQRELKDLSPVHQASRKAAPTLLFHGEKDANVPLEQSKRMVEALNKVQKNATRLV